jgi:hypothetical protein
MNNEHYVAIPTDMVAEPKVFTRSGLMLALHHPDTVWLNCSRLGQLALDKLVAGEASFIIDRTLFLRCTVEVSMADPQFWKRPTARPSVGTIQRAVALHCDLRVEDLESPSRLRRMVRARMIGMHLCRELAGASYSEIGAAFGGRDHSTVINACKRLVELMELHDDLRLAVEVVRAQLVSSASSLACPA